MKILTSYFYQIRNFKPYQIPLSTAISDPAWYHPKNGDYYVDKNGVINGLRIGMLQPQRSLGFLCGGKTCTQQPDSCRFLRAYYDQLCLLDFKELMHLLDQTAEVIQKFLEFEEEPEIILIVHEAPTNPCSERNAIQRYFREHGILCEEFNGGFIMLRQYEGELGIFEYDDAECSVGHSIEGEDRLFWLGTSKSVTVTGILRSTRRMFADATLPAGFKLYLHVRGVRDMTAMFTNAQIPDNFIFSYEADRDLELTNMFHLAKIGDNFVMHVNGDVSILADLCFYSATFAGDFKCKLPWERCTSLHSFFKNVKFSQPVELYLTVPVKANVSGMFDDCTIPDDSYITVQGGASADACYMFNKSCIGANSVINLRDLRANDFSSAFYNCVLQSDVKLLLNTESTDGYVHMFTGAKFPENFDLTLKVPYGANVTGILADVCLPETSNIQIELVNATCLRPEKAELLQKWLQKLAEAKYDDLTSAIAVYVTEHPEKLEECLHINFDNVSAEARIKYVAATAKVFEKTEASWRERMDMF